MSQPEHPPLVVQPTRTSPEQSAVPGEPHSEIETLRADVTALKAAAAKPKSWLERASGVLALVAIVLALPKAIADIRDAFFKSPVTVPFADSSAVFQYDSSEQAIQIRWRFSLHNSGNKADVVRIESARLVRPSLGAHGEEEIFPFDLGGSGFETATATDAAPLQQLLPVPSDSLVDRICVLGRRLAASQVKTMATMPSRRCIRVQLVGATRFPMQSGCFDFLPDDVNTLNSGRDYVVDFDSSL